MVQFWLRRSFPTVVGKAPKQLMLVNQSIAIIAKLRMDLKMIQRLLESPPIRRASITGNLILTINLYRFSDDHGDLPVAGQPVDLRPDDHLPLWPRPRHLLASHG